MKNFHILKVKYLSPTNYKGARVKITSERFEQSKIISYDYSKNSIKDMAIDWLEKEGFEIIGHGEGKNHDYIVSSTFKPLKK